MSDPWTLHRPGLFSLAYRLLGSASDADDVLQEGHLRWLAKAEEIESPRAWLEHVVTNLCLDHLKSARVRRETYIGPWLPEPVATDQSMLHGRPVDPESVSLAFLALLERLSPLERAAFVLVEAFDYSADEAAQVLGREGPAVRQLLHRAREHVREGRPRFAPSKEAHLQMLGTFFSAVQGGDVKQIEALLVSDAHATTDGGGRSRAALNVVQGANRVARFLVGVSTKQVPGVEYEVREVNGWPALVGVLEGVVVAMAQLETDGERVFGVSTWTNPEKLTALRVG
jgi:RNA polymerase sigma-70 factor (ECF subfamily)